MQVDSHAHVYGGPQYKFDPGARFNPHPSQRGTPAQFRAVLHAHGFTHALVVAAQPYGRDNSAMLDAIAESGGRFKGIALVDPALCEKALEKLRDGGIVGFRVNLSSFGLRELTEPGLDRFFAIARALGWFMQIHTVKDDLVPAAELLSQLGTVTGLAKVLDRLGYAADQVAALDVHGRRLDGVVRSPHAPQVELDLLGGLIGGHGTWAPGVRNVSDACRYLHCRCQIRSDLP